MSGRKQASVTISEEMYRRLQRQAERLRELQEELPRVMEDLWEEVARDLRRRLEPLEQKQQRVL